MQSDDLGLVARLNLTPEQTAQLALLDAVWMPKADLERLVAERDEARVDHEHFVAENEINKGRVEADEAERDKLKAALKPFADAAESIDDTVPDRAEMWEAPAAMETTAGDFRRARQALKDAP
jgi:hypothetical protein